MNVNVKLQKDSEMWASLNPSIFTALNINVYNKIQISTALPCLSWIQARFKKLFIGDAYTLYSVLLGFVSKESLSF